MNPMTLRVKEAAASFLLLATFMLGCKFSGGTNNTPPPQPANANANADASKTATPSSKTDADGTIASGTGVEKEKPAAGKGNVQGKALYNGQPAKDVEVKLCEKFNQYFGGCGGETFVAKTDANGEYLIKNVPPRIYEGLVVKVFDENFYVLATLGIVSSAKYNIEADQTYYAPDKNLF